MFRFEKGAGGAGNGSSPDSVSPASSSSESRSREEANTIMFAADLATEISFQTRETFLKRGFSREEADVAGFAAARKVMKGVSDYLVSIKEAGSHIPPESSLQTQKNSVSQIVDLGGGEVKAKSQSQGFNLNVVSEREETKVLFSTSAPLSSSGRTKKGEFDNRQRSLSSSSDRHTKKRSDSADPLDPSGPSGGPGLSGM